MGVIVKNNEEAEKKCKECFHYKLCKYAINIDIRLENCMGFKDKKEKEDD